MKCLHIYIPYIFHTYQTYFMIHNVYFQRMLLNFHCYREYKLSVWPKKKSQTVETLCVMVFAPTALYVSNLAGFFSKAFEKRKAINIYFAFILQVL